jgi:hypothetical protein
MRLAETYQNGNLSSAQRRQVIVPDSGLWNIRGWIGQRPCGKSLTEPTLLKT